MLYGCVTWSPRACHYDTLHRAHQSFRARCIGWRNDNRTEHPISYLDTLMMTRSESIEASLRRRLILFAGFVAHMKDTRLSKCVIFGEVVGGMGCVFFLFVCISLIMTDGPRRARLPIPPTTMLPSYLWSRRIVPSRPGSCFTNFYRDASSALLQLVNQ